MGSESSEPVRPDGFISFRIFIVGPEPDGDGITLSEKKPPHNGYPSNGEESDRNNRQIEPAHPLLIFLRPTKLLLNY
jgi:hypothetical protein